MVGAKSLEGETNSVRSVSSGWLDEVDHADAVERHERVSPRDTLRRPFFVDLLGERVHLRSLTVAVFCIMFLLLYGSISGLYVEEKVVVGRVKLASSLPSIVTVREGDWARTPGVTVTSTAGKSYPDIGVKMEFVQLLQTDFNNRFLCDTALLGKTAASLEYLRRRDVCSLVATNTTSATSAEGVARFDKVDMVRGPPGRYVIDFVTQNVDGPRSAVQDMTSLDTDVSTVQVLVPAPGRVAVGPLPQTPVLQLFNMFMEPVPDSHCVATTYQEADFFLQFLDRAEDSPNWSRFMTMSKFGKRASNFWGLNFALLSGEVSTTSDENGVVHFPNLTIVTSSSRFVYIVFDCEGTVVGWNNPRAGSRLIAVPDLPRYIAPTFIAVGEGPQGVAAIEVSVGGVSADSRSAPMITVAEGEAIPPVTARMLGGTNGTAPVEGVTALAVITAVPTSEVARWEFPKLFRPMVKLTEIYDPRFKFLRGVVSTVSTEDGFVSFTNLTFSNVGEAGIFEVMICASGICAPDSMRFSVNVTSLSARLMISRRPESLPLFGSLPAATHSEPTVRLVDARGNGIEGKVVRARVEASCFPIFSETERAGFNTGCPVKIIAEGGNTTVADLGCKSFDVLQDFFTSAPEELMRRGEITAEQLNSIVDAGLGSMAEVFDLGGRLIGGVKARGCVRQRVPESINTTLSDVEIEAFGFVVDVGGVEIDACIAGCERVPSCIMPAPPPPPPPILPPYTVEKGCGVPVAGPETDLSTDIIFAEQQIPVVTGSSGFAVFPLRALVANTRALRLSKGRRLRIVFEADGLEVRGEMPVFITGVKAEARQAARVQTPAKVVWLAPPSDQIVVVPGLVEVPPFVVLDTEGRPIADFQLEPYSVEDYGSRTKTMYEIAHSRLFVARLGEDSRTFRMPENTDRVAYTEACGTFVTDANGRHAGGQFLVVTGETGTMRWRLRPVSSDAATLMARSCEVLDAATFNEATDARPMACSDTVYTQIYNDIERVGVDFAYPGNPLDFISSYQSGDFTAMSSDGVDELRIDSLPYPWYSMQVGFFRTRVILKPGVDQSEMSRRSVRIGEWLKLA